MKISKPTELLNAFEVAARRLNKAFLESDYMSYSLHPFIISSLYGSSKSHLRGRKKCHVMLVYKSYTFTEGGKHPYLFHKERKMNIKGRLLYPFNRLVFFSLPLLASRTTTVHPSSEGLL